MNEVKTQMRTFLGRFARNRELGDDDDIFAMGFVNSLFAMELVLFTEKTFGITIEQEDMDFDNFRSLNAIAQLIERKNGE